MQTSILGVTSPDGEKTARILLDHARRKHTLRAWPTGAAHEKAMRLALSSALRTAMSRAERGDTGWDQALNDVTQKSDAAGLQGLLTEALHQLELIGGSPSAVAVMHLRIAAVALVRGDHAEAEANFAAALKLEAGDSIAACGLRHVRGHPVLEIAHRNAVPPASSRDRDSGVGR